VLFRRDPAAVHEHGDPAAGAREHHLGGKSQHQHPADGSGQRRVGLRSFAAGDQPGQGGEGGHAGGQAEHAHGDIHQLLAVLKGGDGARTDEGTEAAQDPVVHRDDGPGDHDGDRSDQVRLQVGMVQAQDRPPVEALAEAAGQRQGERSDGAPHQHTPGKSVSAGGGAADEAAGNDGGGVAQRGQGGDEMAVTGLQHR